MPHGCLHKNSTQNKARNIKNLLAGPLLEPQFSYCWHQPFFWLNICFDSVNHQQNLLQWDWMGCCCCQRVGNVLIHVGRIFFWCVRRHILFVKLQKYLTNKNYYDSHYLSSVKATIPFVLRNTKQDQLAWNDWIPSLIDWSVASSSGPDRSRF